jgi:PAS domain S-box-containing protein
MEKEPDQLAGQSFLSLFAEPSRDAVDRQVASLSRENPAAVIEYPIKDLQGRIRLLRLSVRAIYDLQGRFIEYLCAYMDVPALRQSEQSREEGKTKEALDRIINEKTAETLASNRLLRQEIEERRQTEERLRESEERYRGILDSIVDGYYETDLAGDLTFANPALCRMMGYSEDEIKGSNYQKFASEDGSGDLYAVFRQVFTTGRPLKMVDLKVADKDGCPRHIEMSVSPVPNSRGRFTGFRGIVRDVTKRKNAEKELSESEARYRTIVEQQSEAVCRWRPDTTLTFINDGYCRLFGRQRGELLGSPWIDLLRERKREILESIKSLALAPKVFSHEQEILGTEGKIRWIQWMNAPVYDSRGQLLEYQSVGRDVTEQKLVAEALRKSEALYRAIFENTGAAALIFDENTIISLVNDKFEEMTAYSREETEGKRSWKPMIPQRELERVLNYHRLRRVSTNAAPRSYETQIMDKHGRVKNVLVTVDLIPGTTQSIASIVDICDRYEAEKALRKRERDLKTQTRKLEEATAALKALLKARSEEKSDFEKEILSNIRQLVLPVLERLKNIPKNGDDLSGHIEQLERNLHNAISPLMNDLKARCWNLTPREIEVVCLIREGKTTKDISKRMNVSAKTVEYYRDSIRKKFGLTSRRANLRSFVATLK